MGQVKFTLEADEAKAVRAYMRVVEAQNKAEGGAKRLGRTGKKSTEDISSGAGKASDKLGSMIMRYASVGALIASVGRAATSELNNMAQAADNARQRLEAARDLMFMGDWAQRHPDAQGDIGRLAYKAALPGVEGKKEVAESWEILTSITPYLTDEQRKGILEKGAEFRRTTKTPLLTLWQMMSQIQKTDPTANAQMISNFIQQTKIESGSDTEQMAQYLTRMLGVGQVGGLTVPETAAMYAAATGREQPEVAATGLRRMLMSLQGKELTKEGQQVKRRLGLKKGMGVMDQMGALYEAQQAGNLSLADLQVLFQERGGALAALLIPEYPNMMQSLQKIRGAYRTPGLDMIGQATGMIYQPHTMMGMEENLRRQEARKDQIQFELDAKAGMQRKLIQETLYNESRQQGNPHWWAWMESTFGSIGGMPGVVNATDAVGDTTIDIINAFKEWGNGFIESLKNFKYSDLKAPGVMGGDLKSPFNTPN